MRTIKENGAQPERKIIYSFAARISVRINGQRHFVGHARSRLRIRKLLKNRDWKRQQNGL